MVLLFHLQHFSAQIGHHQEIHEECTNDDGNIYKHYNASIDLLVELDRTRPNWLWSTSLPSNLYLAEASREFLAYSFCSAVVKHDHINVQIELHWPDTGKL
jgi:hypothetical protein